jgi:hypothetical protein
VKADTAPVTAPVRRRRSAFRRGRPGALFVVLVVSACAWTASAAAATRTTIATLNRSSAIQAYDGTAVWSDYDVASRSWHLVVRRDGQLSTPTIPAAAKSIEVDVGPGVSGAPELAYVSCIEGCHVVVSAADGTDQRTVPGSTGASHPTIWGDRVAWVSGRANVLLSRVDGERRHVLGGAPRRKCYYSALLANPTLVCARPQEPSVDSLQLYKGQLALVDTFVLNDNVGTVGTTTEVRTEPVAGGAQHLVALLGVGEGDESWLNPSWSGGTLYFYEDSLGAGFTVYRFDPARDTYARARANAYLTGYSVNGDSVYEATAPGGPRPGYPCGEEGMPCVVRLSGLPAFKRSRAPVHVP